MLAARANVLNFATLLLAGAALSACSTVHPNLSHRAPGGQAAGPATAGAQPTGRGGVYKVGKPYQVAGIWYVPKEEPNYDVTGVASWYGQDFHMKPTANGETFDMHAVSAAHTTLPMPSIVEVTNLENGRKIRVRLNDRGPFVGGRIIDLSYAAARELGYENKGLANVRVRYIGPAPLGVNEGQRYASVSNAPTAATPIPVPTATTPVAARPLPPPAPVAAQSLPPLAAPAPGPAPSQYAAAAPSPAYGGPNVTYAPTARPDYKPPAPATAYPPAYSPAATASTAYKIQAAAFSDPAKAQRVADELAGAGPARVETVERDGAPIYRVMVPASADEGEAWALRDRIAAYGYADARVIRPF